VRVDADGLAGWGEAHAARAPTVIAELVESTLAALVVGMPADDVEAVWERVYRMQLASHGCGAAAVIGLSGIDMALWDLKGKAAGRPLHALLGGVARAIPAYAGGVALGYGPPAALVAEARGLVEQGFTALKLRVGAGVAHDIARIEALRAALGDGVAILADANTACSVAEVRALAPCLAACRVGWLEEPFPAHDVRAYRSAARMLAIPLAAGENHYTRFDFEHLRDAGAVSVWQPDLSKCGGITEGLRIAALAAAAGITVHPHTSVTGLNMAASLHVLAAIPNAGWFEADVTPFNPFRDRLCWPALAPPAGAVYRPPPGPGLGVAIDLAMLAATGVIPGPGYV
jgi:L-alanine-DL-glutamate epimerase-like enolase superfamily enzyme